ncbi:NAD(P)-dependent oxidoreductase [Chitinophaga sp. MM2321]|uniref:2-hydroxyacid dehydrogenase n=1 Tax=Chitinophaga sp. MM2321 TaxID=3137178 RepID=UPI0032D5AB2D
MKTKVLITGNIPREWVSALEPVSAITIWPGNGSFTMPRNDLLAEIGNYHGIVNFAEVKADQELIQHAHNLKVIANASIGYDNLNLPLLTTHNIWASNAPGFFNYPVAEYVFAGMMTISRRLLESDDFIRQGKWHSFEPGRWDGISLKEKTVGIIGLGSIGKHLRLMLKAIGANVIYNTPSPKEEEGWVSFEELISTSDIISIHIPLTSKTRNLIDSNAIAKIREGAIVINTSRGLIMDEAALIRALQSGKLAGAVLDVFENEPHVPAELKNMRNVLLTPHMAGGTKSARAACLKRAISNVAAVLQGNKPMNALNQLS